MEPAEAMTEVLVEIVGGVATITLHRPEALNAFTQTMTLALDEALAVGEQLLELLAVGVMVLALLALARERDVRLVRRVVHDVARGDRDSQGRDLAGSAIDVKGVKVLVAKLEGADQKTLRDTLDQLKGKLPSSAIVLAASEGEKVSLIAGVTQDLISRVKAGDLVNFVASQVGGKGGGRPDMAQAGGTNAAALPEALASVKSWVEERL